MRKVLCCILIAAMLATSLLLTVSAKTVTVKTYENIAKGASYTASAPYTLTTYPNPYQQIDGKELTDGVFGSALYGTEWHGFYNGSDDFKADGNYWAVIDLGSVKTGVGKLDMEFSNNPTASVFLPKKVTFYASNDNLEFTSLGEATVQNPDDACVKYALVKDTEVSGRYFKAVIERDNGMFVFCSEFEVCKVSGTTEVNEPEKPAPDGLVFTGTTTLDVVDGYLYGLPNNTTCDGFFEYTIAPRDDTVVFKDSKGNAKATGLLATGDKVSKLDDEGNVVESLTIIIDGDVNCDGEVDLIDYLMIKRVALGTYAITGVAETAALFDGEVDAGAYLKLKRQVLGTYNLYAKYNDRVAPLYSTGMTITRVSAGAYRFSSTYLGKPMSLTFDKKTWGTWNLGTFTYSGTSFAGGGTDWEYVYRAGTSKSNSSTWSGGNHGNEALISLKMYNSETGAEIVLENTGNSTTAKGLKIVEKTTLNLGTAASTYCNVVRTYYIAGNRIELDVTYDYTKDTYHQLSYTCMFCIWKTHGRYCEYQFEDGSTKTYTTSLIGKSDYSGPMDINNASAKVIMYGDTNPTWRWTAEVYTLRDSLDNFKNADKTFYWDMNTNQNKLYFSKFNSGSGTLVPAGTNYGTSCAWEFNVVDA